MGADAFHMTAPNVDGPKRAMKAALRNAGVNADAVQYLNAHGTSTPLGDVNETNAIKLAFWRPRASDGGELHQVDDRPPAGRRRRHRVGVHGAGAAPPGEPADHQHLQTRTPSATSTTARTWRAMRIDVAVKNNFGFGGTNGTLVFRRV
jgi:3-oxoacyl-[acyl-carrier-protein] synthase II